MPFRSALLLLAFAAAAAPAAELDPAATRIKKDLEYLAGDECQGRGLKTQGLTKAGDYIAKAFKDAGLKSAFDDGSYFQPFTVFGTGKLANPISLAFKTDAGKVEYDFGKTFAPTEASGPGKVAAGLVFVGYGISAPDKKYDDYAGVDVKGKVVIVLRRMPRADAKAHLANGIAKSEAVLKLYLRYDAQLHRHYRNCLKDLRDLQAQRRSPDEPNTPPKPPTRETETAPPIGPNVSKPEPEPDEPTLTPEQARLKYMQSEIQRFEDYQAQVFRASFPQSQPE